MVKADMRKGMLLKGKIGAEERIYRVSIGELDENPFKFETSIKNETR